MLDRFLIIGAGGSGGRTLRLLQSSLKQRLGAQGWTGDLPASWNFLHVDVPTTADVDDTGPAGKIRYVGLARATEMYLQMDQAVSSRGREVAREFSRWRPQPDRIQVNPVHGAGQYRAVGRVVQAAAMPRLVQMLTEVVSETTSAATADLAQISSLFGDHETGAPGLKIIVVSSLAGGAGSGIFLDICDALRNLQAAGQDGTTALLYAPDIFRELSGPLTEFLMYNALAATSELISATWNNETPDPNGEFALLGDAGIAVPQAPVHRGPRYSFILSSTNGAITLPTQRDAYQLVASTVSSWMTQTSIQQQMDSVLLAGWPMVGARYTDHLGITLGETQPFSSLGYGSLGLGRDKFAQYATRRLTGEVARHLLNAHRPEGETSDAAALSRLATAYSPTFLSQAGLAEAGPDDNQVLDALRGDTFKSRASALAHEEHRSLVTAVTGERSEVRRDDAVAMLSSTASDRAGSFHSEQAAARDLKAAEWVTKVQRDTLAATATSLQRNGGPGTVAILNSAIDQLRNHVVPELRSDGATFTGKATKSAQQQGIASMLAGLANRVSASDTRLATAMQQVVNRWIWTSESQLHTLAADLLTDFLTNFLTPLARSIDTAVQLLARDWTGTPTRPAKLERWASGVADEDLLPQEYEVRLEDATTWSSTLDRLIKANTGQLGRDTAFRRLLAEVFTADTSWVTTEGDWSPSQQILATAEGTPARFTISLRAGDLESAAGVWVSRPDRALHQHIRQSLASWVSEDPVLADERALQLQTGLVRVLNTALPLVDLDEHTADTLLGVHDIRSNVRRLMTPIPLAPSLPVAQAIAHTLQQDYGFDTAAIAEAFDAASDPVSIDVITTLAGPVSPLVMRSLVGPIAAKLDATQTLSPDYTAPLYPEEWLGRRSRRLAASLPVPPHLWRALLRGWFTARFFGQLDLSAPREPKIWNGSGWTAFEHLLPPFPRKETEVLGSVLEGLPYAFVAAPLTPSAWAPIRALAAAGGWTQNDIQSDIVIPLVDTWLRSGETPGGSPLQVDGHLVGTTPLERLTSLTDRLTAVGAQYDAIAVAGPPEPYDRNQVTRYDIAAGVAFALAQVRAAAAQSSALEDEGDPTDPDV